MNANNEIDEQTSPCRICGRKFVKSSLEKHEPACKKLTKMQRKIFDSGKQRASGSDIPLKDVRKAAKDREKVGGVFPRPQTHWRERHEEFIGALSSSKQVDRVLKKAEPLPPPARTAGTSSGNICCEFCGRTFSQNAAERHIAFCKEKSFQRAVKERSASKCGRNSGTSRTHSSIIGAPKAATPSASSRKGRPGSVGPRRMGAGGGGATAEGAAEGLGGRKTPTASRQSQATKRSTSAPKNNNSSKPANGSGCSKSSFSTPKTAGSSKGKVGEKGGEAKLSSKQKLG